MLARTAGQPDESFQICLIDRNQKLVIFHCFLCMKIVFFALKTYRVSCQCNWYVTVLNATNKMFTQKAMENQQLFISGNLFFTGNSRRAVRRSRRAALCNLLYSACTMESPLQRLHNGILYGMNHNAIPRRRQSQRNPLWEESQRNPLCKEITMQFSQCNLFGWPATNTELLTDWLIDPIRDCNYEFVWPVWTDWQGNGSDPLWKSIVFLICVEACWNHKIQKVDLSL